MRVAWGGKVSGILLNLRRGGDTVCTGANVEKAVGREHIALNADWLSYALKIRRLRKRCARRVRDLLSHGWLQWVWQHQ